MVERSTSSSIDQKPQDLTLEQIALRPQPDNTSGLAGKIDKLPNFSHLVPHQPVGQIAARYDGEHLAIVHDRQVPESWFLYRVADDVIDGRAT